MGVPYEPWPIAGIEVIGGRTNVTVVQIPPRCIITKLIVTQTGGTLAAFDVDLYNQRDAAGNFPESESTSASTPGPDGVPIPLECFRVSSTMHSEEPGYLEYFSDQEGTGHGLGFFCHDKVKDRQGQNLGNLYVCITPGGVGDMIFAIAIGVEETITGV